MGGGASSLDDTIVEGERVTRAGSVSGIENDDNDDNDDRSRLGNDRRKVTTNSCLAPFSRLHNDYQLANYHPPIEYRKRDNRQINKLFRLFAALIRNN